MALVGMPERKLSPGRSRYGREIIEELIQQVGCVATE
jgi:hypothetical protein